MPPVGQAIASWTPQGSAHVSADPHCPRKESAKNDCLISRLFTAAVHTARMRNTLAILLMALAILLAALAIHLAALAILLGALVILLGALAILLAALASDDF